MNRLTWMLAATGVVMVAAGPALSARIGQEPGEGDFAIYVAPGVLVKSAPCPCVTIHTEVARSAVDGVAVEINGVALTDFHTYSDSRGNLVVKMAFDDAIACLDDAAATATFELTLVVDGDVIAASDTVTVND